MIADNTIAMGIINGRMSMVTASVEELLRAIFRML
jgi:hypothetical protein